MIMNTKKDFIHPYIPNSVPANKEAMMKKIGITDRVDGSASS